MASLGNDFHIKVSTEELLAKADTVSGVLEELRGLFEELHAGINRTSLYWEGEGASIRRSEYDGKKKTVEKMLKRLREYPTDLLKMAGVYEKAELEAAEQILTLSSDVII